MKRVAAPKISLLGNFEFHLGQTDIAAGLSPRDRVLLAYLCWKNGKPAQREQLIEDLWPGLPPARGLRALNTALWRIRRAIRASGHRVAHLLDSRHAQVRLEMSEDVETDAAKVVTLGEDLLTKAAEHLAEPDLQTLKRVVQACRGAFLPECYDDWSHLPREIVRSRFACLQEVLVQALMKRKAWREAICIALPIVELDPTNELAHQWLIRCHLALGEHVRAKAQFKKCERVLRDELGVAPLEETSAILGETAARPKHTRRLDPERLDLALRKLDLARDAFVELSREP